MKALFSTIIVSMFFFVNAFAQGTATQVVKVNVPSVALIDVVQPAGGISLTLTAPEAAGDWLTAGTSATSSNTYLNLSSVKNDKDRKITVEGEDIPSGLNLTVKATAAGTNNGNLGSAGDEVILTGSAQEIVTGITSGYSGKGSSKGFQITYTLSVDTENLSSLTVQDENEITVTYTITE